MVVDLLDHQKTYTLHLTNPSSWFIYFQPLYRYDLSLLYPLE